MFPSDMQAMSALNVSDFACSSRYDRMTRNLRANLVENRFKLAHKFCTSLYVKLIEAFTSFGEQFDSLTFLGRCVLHIT